MVKEFGSVVELSSEEPVLSVYRASGGLQTIKQRSNTSGVGFAGKGAAGVAWKRAQL